jgi:hypothetical protein
MDLTNAKITAPVAPKFGGRPVDLQVVDIAAEHRESVILWLAGRGLKEVLEDAGAGDAAGFAKKLDSIKRGETPATRARRDPVEVEAEKIARGKITAKAKAAGRKLTSIENMDELVAQVLAKYPDIRETARRNVTARASVATDIDIEL